MPSLQMLALRYLAWFIGLRILYSVLVQFAGLPNLPATGVMLASIPAIDIGMQAARRATRRLSFGDWATIWGLCVSIFALIQIVLPAVIFAQMRAALADPVWLQLTVILLAATAAMMAVFLFIGARIKR